MNVLIACEESQTVCTEFRARGHNAFSCDLLNCSGGHPEWHILGSALDVINGRTTFCTEDGSEHQIEGRWDLIVAHPPCTDLAVSGARWFPEKQKDLRQQKSVAFFMQMALADCDHVAVENPVGIMSTCWRKPDQIIQPWQFGDPFEKTTCLWLKNLPKLTPTEIVTPPPRQVLRSGKTLPEWYSNCGGNRPKARSKTFPGIGRAIAEQWGAICEEGNDK